MQFLKSRPDEVQVADSLRFLLAAMGALKKRNPLTESFLVQLDVDLEALGTRIPKLRAAFPRNTETHYVSNSGEFVRARILSGTALQKPSPMSAQPEGGQSGHGIMASTTQHCNYMAEDNSSSNNNNNNIGCNKTPSKSPEVIEIDPTLTSVPQQPIPSFSALNGRWPSESSLTILERMRQQGGNTRFFGSSLMQDLLNPDDVSLSPDTGHSSDRPTPDSTASASDRQQVGSNSNLATGPSSSSRSGPTSFETSPASTSARTQTHSQQQQQQQEQSNAARAVQAMFAEFQNGGPFAVPETPKDATVEGSGAAGNTSNGDEFSWENFAAGGTGMTPMSEGVLRTMLQMGPMETMDLGWDNPP